MATMNARIFFNEQEKRMNFSDDDMDDSYVARMTGENEHPAKEKKLDNDYTQNVPYASQTRGYKRKTGRSTPLRSSPRIKRSKISLASANPQVDAQDGDSNDLSSDDALDFSFPGDVTPNRHHSDSSNQSFSRAPDSVARVKVEPTMIIDGPLATINSRHTRLPSKSFSDNSSDASTAPSSPIEEPRSLSPVPATNGKAPEKEKSMLEIILEAKHSTHRRRVKKLVPLAQLQTKPKHQINSVDETSIIDNYSSSEAPTSPDIACSSSIVKVGSKSAESTKSSISKSRPSAAPKLAVKLSATIKVKGKGKTTAPSTKLTPYEFVCQIQHTQVNKAGKVQFLEGLRIFYCGMDINSKLSGDSTEKRIMIILRHGGSVVPRYQPDQITHIIVDKTLGQNSFLKATGLQKLTDVPDHIPILTWQWVVDMMDMNPFLNNGKVLKIRQVSSLFEYGAYPNRLPPVSISATSKYFEQKRAPQLRDEDRDFSRISEFSANDTKPEVGSSRHETLESKHVRNTMIKLASTRLPLDFQFHKPVNQEIVDPLVEFYLQRKANEHHRNKFDSDTDDSDLEPHYQQAGLKPKRDWLCKKPNQNAKPGPNEDIVRKLEELQELHKVKPTEDDHWRVYSYSKSIRALRAHPKRIKSLEDAEKIQGVGKKTAQKIMEIIETGNLQRIAYERTEDVKVISLFTKIYGVGIQTATMWYARGCRTIEDLCNGVGDVALNEGQRIGIEFYDDLNSRMPREEAKAIFELIKPIALRLDPTLFVEIMGSYRRGKTDCGDIDILITRCPDDGLTHEGILHKLLERLHTAGILTEDLALPDYSKPLEAVYHGICRLPNVVGARRRRIDFLTVPYSSKGGALLYYTGDDMFNRSMRLLASKMGYSLNQRGLYAGVVRDPRNRTVKLNTGNLIASETEEQIFKALGVPWREPHERVTYYQDIVKAEEEKSKKTTTIIAKQ
ncbi:DNA polymerase lambda [Lentinula lateritia]|nr:DNA polymerase lambda [Lentinula lateritia]